MQTDFHHTVTYICARIAGFDHPSADIIAYSAQYVDDSVSEGVIHFDNKAMYSKIHSAHKITDIDNFNNDENILVWLPFHFIPGNGGRQAGDDADGKFIHKIICKPDSPPAREMVQSAIDDKGKPYSLHRLGIAMHVYADTWAHQGFVGVLHKVNEVGDAMETGGSGVFSKKLQTFLTNLVEKVPPLGHGRARDFPDLPFLSWKYTNGLGNSVPRNNTEEFCQAADAMCTAMQRYRGVPEKGMGVQDMRMMRNLFKELKIEDEKLRHGQWIEEIARGMFSFGKATVAYAVEGPNSWKYQALGESGEKGIHKYDSRFLTSNWKLFHDALQWHRLTVLHDILPKYGICSG